jgi:hypothetical protein
MSKYTLEFYEQLRDIVITIKEELTGQEIVNMVEMVNGIGLQYGYRHMIVSLVQNISRGAGSLNTYKSLGFCVVSEFSSNVYVNAQSSDLVYFLLKLPIAFMQ